MLHQIKTSHCRITVCSLLFTLFALAPATLIVAAPTAPENCISNDNGGEQLQLPREMFVGLQTIPPYVFALQQSDSLPATADLAVPCYDMNSICDLIITHKALLGLPGNTELKAVLQVTITSACRWIHSLRNSSVSTNNVTTASNQTAEDRACQPGNVLSQELEQYCINKRVALISNKAYIGALYYCFQDDSCPVSPNSCLWATNNLPDTVAESVKTHLGCMLDM